MRSFIVTAGLIFLCSCLSGDKNFDGTPKNFETIRVDSNCISAWSNAYFELKTKNFDTVVSTINSKIVSVIGSEAFNDRQFKIMYDSIKQSVFNMETALLFGDVQIDTTNLLPLKNRLEYPSQADVTFRKNVGWKNTFTQNDLFTYQTAPNFEIGYTITPCIKQMLGYVGKFKRNRKRSLLPAYAKESNVLIDEINIYDCIVNISTVISIDDKSGLLKSRRQFYEVVITDTAKVFTQIDLTTHK